MVHLSKKLKFKKSLSLKNTEYLIKVSLNIEIFKPAVHYLHSKKKKQQLVQGFEFTINNHLT